MISQYYASGEKDALFAGVSMPFESCCRMRECERQIKSSAYQSVFCTIDCHYNFPFIVEMIHYADDSLLSNYGTMWTCAYLCEMRLDSRVQANGQYQKNVSKREKKQKVSLKKLLPFPFTTAQFFLAHCVNCPYESTRC